MPTDLERALSLTSSARRSLEQALKYVGHHDYTGHASLRERLQKTINAAQESEYYLQRRVKAEE